MASTSKKAGTISVGAVLIVVVVIGLKLLGGPDLTGLLTESGSQSSQTSASQTPASGQPTAPKPDAEPRASDRARDTTATQTADESAIRALIDSQTSGEMVELHAEIVKLLPDDNEGSRHQRLLLKLQTGGTMLVAHNIDLAERIPAEQGDWITVYGQYEWNDRGGVLHWTHHDPKNWREGGWIEHAGVRYE